MFLGPSGMRYTKLKIHEIRHDLSGTLVRDGMFSMPAKGLTVYAHRKDNNSIDGILVHDNRNSSSPITYSAEKGYLINENNNPKLILLNGNIQYRNLLIDGPGMTTVSFEKNEYLFSDFLTENKNFNFASTEVNTYESEIKPDLFFCDSCQIIFSSLWPFEELNLFTF